MRLRLIAGLSLLALAVFLRERTTSQTIFRSPLREKRGQPGFEKPNLPALPSRTAGSRPQAALEDLYFNWPLDRIADLRARAIALPAGEEKAIALLAVVVPWAETDPSAALAWLDQSGFRADSSRADEILRRVLIPLASQDPATALRTLRDRPELEAQPSVLRLAVEIALRRETEMGGDPVEILAWANHNIADPNLWDQATQEIVGTTLRRSPERGSTLLQSLGDAKLLATFGSSRND